MTNTPEQTLSDLLALGEKATKGEWLANNMSVGLHKNARAGYPPTPGTIASLFDGEYIENGNYNNDAAFIAASKNALPALREYMEMVEGLRDIGGQMALHLHLVAVQLEDKIDARKATELANKFRALSRLGGK